MAAPGMILQTDVTQGQILPLIMDTDKSWQKELANAFRKWRELTERVQDLSNSLSIVVFSFFAKIQYCFWVFSFPKDPFENDGEFPCCTRLLHVEDSRMESLLWLDLALKLQGPSLLTWANSLQMACMPWIYIAQMAVTLFFVVSCSYYHYQEKWRLHIR